MKKTRTIIAAIIMFLIILLLIVILIAVATQRPAGSQNIANIDTTTVAMVDSDSTGTQNDAEEGNLPPVSNSDDAATVQSTPENSEPETSDVKIIDTKNEKLPQSGPESILPIALLLGSATTFMMSCICVRKKRVL